MMGRSKHFSPFDIEMMIDDAEMIQDVHLRWIFSFGWFSWASGEKRS